MEEGIRNLADNEVSLHSKLYNVKRGNKRSIDLEALLDDSSMHDN